MCLGIRDFLFYPEAGVSGHVCWPHCSTISNDKLYYMLLWWYW